ncbi:MAG: phosphatidylserine decarboxylase [Candidatus Hodarchaeales archaeon]
MTIRIAKGHEPFTFVFITSSLMFTFLTIWLSYHVIPLFLLITSLTLTIFNILFFRDPDRTCRTRDKNCIIAPADGTVFEIGEEFNEEEGMKMIVIKIRMSLFNVHVNRSPCNGIIDSIKREKGSFWPMSLITQSKTKGNAKQIVRMICDNGIIIYLVQISGFVARRCVLYWEKGSRLKAGQRIGMIRYGSEVDTWIPINKYDVIIQKGEKTKAGQAVIAVPIKNGENN